ncbi:MAG: VWA domain-containing protein [Verrucomicrobiota bacterium]
MVLVAIGLWLGGALLCINPGVNLVARRAMSGFVFQWPALLALLLLAIPLWLVLVYARRRRAALIRVMGGGLNTHRLLRDVLRFSAFILLVLALARPGYAPRMESSSRVGRDVIFALDVSQSMLAEDAAPSRLEVAKQGIRDALKSFVNERVGLVVYAGSASILCPLTYDYDFVRFMLEQANPRSVDFGGTALQSAVEKAVDQVFMDGRGGVQDLVVLTDGGDHGSKMARVIELLRQKSVDVLAVGIGDPNQGSPIPIKSEEGNIQFLQDDGQVVYTKLDDGALRAFASETPFADYVAAGVRPFNLGQLYSDYAAGKTTDSTDSKSGIVVYQEAVFFFLWPAMILLILAECWGVRGLQIGSAVCCLVLLVDSQVLDAADESFRSEFANVAGLFAEGDFEGAENGFSALYAYASDSSANASDLAVVQFNRGLCLLELAKAQEGENPGIALTYAENAQLAFLTAKRYTPKMQRAGIRLESTAGYMVELQSAIDADRQVQDELNAEMEALVERLQALLQAQKQLRDSTNTKDVDRVVRRRKNAPPPPPVVPPADASQSSRLFAQEQAELHTEAMGVKTMMQAINEKMAMQLDPDLPEMDTLMEEPLEFMDRALEAQLKAEELFAVGWGSWPTARVEQQLVERLIEAILELLAGSSDQESEADEDYEDYEEDYESDYLEDSEESMSSDSIEGDLAAGVEMQELPVPNYSVDDILLEEQGNLQFRQQKRASANAGKVEKDY